MNMTWQSAVAAVMSVCSLLSASLFCINYSDDMVVFATSIKEVTEVSATEQEVETSSPVSTPKTSQVPTVAESSSSVAAVTSEKESVSSKASSTIPAAANSKKLGSITPQFFSPYTTANLHKGKVYVNNRTGLKVDINTLIKGYNLKITDDSPQVLIVHTHATENYSTKDTYYTKEDMARTGDESRNVIGVGNEVERVLKKAGIGVIHDKTLHDSPSYSGSYTRSYNTVENYLKKYPNIKVVLDIHRDAIGEGDDLVKPVTEIKGKKAAQVMICVGSNTGSVDYYPNWEKNLSFGLKLQQNLETLYPGLARALYVAYDRCWNQNLSTGSIIIEFGTNGNTFKEAKYSATLVGNGLVATLK